MTSKARGQLPRLFEEAEFAKLCAEVRMIRVRAAQMKGAGFDPRFHPFVRGLRLSALLIYRIRELLRASGLTASWGQLIDRDENACSPECDIIIHRECATQRWNGDAGGSLHVMDFHFVPSEQALVVISCKSLIKSPSHHASGVDAEYTSKLRPYVKAVWLFAECCKKGCVGRIRKAARKASYQGFWYLYEWENDEPDIDVIKVARSDVWLDFVKTIKQLATSAPCRRR